MGTEEQNKACTEYCGKCPDWEHVELDEYGWWGSCCKWYSWSEDFVILSLLFPQIEFHVEGDGEDGEDFWRARFLNGKFQHVNVEFNFPEFDPWDQVT